MPINDKFRLKVGNNSLAGIRKKGFLEKVSNIFLQIRFRLRSFFISFLRFIKKNKVLLLARKFWKASKILFPWEKRLVWFLLIVFLAGLGFFIREKYLASTLETPESGGLYIEGVVGEPSQINPIFAKTDSDRAISRLIFRGLTKIGPDKKIIGDIANYKISQDGQRYIFTIKDGAYWHDGEKVIADDVLFTISLLQDQDYDGPFAGIWDSVEAKKINDQKIELNLTEPYAPFLESTIIGILPSHILGGLSVKDIEESEFSTNPIGCGPYKISRSLSPKDSKIKFLTLEKFNKFYENDVKIEKITFNFYSSWKEAVKAFERGESTGIGNLTPDKEKYFTTKKDLILHEFMVPQYMALFFNMRRPGLSNQTVRKAILETIDKKNIFKIYGGSGKIINGPVLPGTLGFKKEFLPKRNPKSAINLLENDGYKKNKENIFQKNKTSLSFTLVTVNNALNKKIADSIKSQVKEIGINLKIKTLPLANLQATYIIPRNYDMVLIGENLGLDPDPYGFWHSSQSNKGGLNLSNYSNKKVDSLISDARDTLKDKDRAKKYSKISDLIEKDIPAIFLYQPNDVYATNRALKGVRGDWIINDSDRFFFINEWYLKTKRIKK